MEYYHAWVVAANCYFYMLVIQMCNVVFMCNNMDTRGLGSAILEFLAAITFRKNT